MGGTFLKIIIDQLNQYIQSVEPHSTSAPTSLPVKLGNIATARFAGGDNGDLSEKVVVSLVNIAEEAAVKNLQNGKIRNGQYVSMHPVVHVNLFLLFTANFDSYEVAINHLFRVIEFFQGRKIFKFKNSPVAGLSLQNIENMGEAEITIELNTLSFEQLNDLWGSLGGKQMPFVLYKCRLLPIQMEQVLQHEGIITEIDLTTKGP